MDLPTPDSYGEAFADVYDEWYGEVTDADACASRLARLAPAGRVLELGVGTGRLALPLVRHGLEVSGLDASAAMLARLQTKPGADALELVQGDMGALADVRFGRAPFDLVLVAYNTLFNLPDEPAQRRCLAGAAALLDRDGHLVVEAFVPGEPTDRLDDVAVRSITADAVILTVTLHDPGAQTITGQHVELSERGVRLRPWRVRYLHVAQLDALADEAGLALVDRWSDWQATPYDEDSPVHISVYRNA